MIFYVLVIAVLFEGQIYTAAFNGGDQSKPYTSFSKKADCEAEKARQMKQMDKILSPGATLIELNCVERKGGGV